MSRVVLPDYIYRPARMYIATELSLYKRHDYATGLSFMDEPPVSEYIRFKTSDLIRHNYQVRVNADQRIKNIWTNKIYVDLPGFDGTARFNSGHVSVWYNNHDYWYLWHQTDLANSGTKKVSKQLKAFFRLAKLAR